MLANLKARRDSEEGFTLIELMVVVLIIAILIAIAIPTFLGARERAQERAAQSSARNGLTAAKTLFTDNESYQAVEVAGEMSAVEPSLTYSVGAAPAASTGQNDLSMLVTDVIAGDDNVLTIAVLSKSGTCFFLRDTATGANAGTTYNEGPGASCAATDAPAAGWTTTGW